MASIEIKERVHRLIDESDDPTLLAIEQMLKNHQQEQFWDEEEIEALNRDIEQSEKEYAEGKFITNDELKLRMQSW